MSWGLPKFDHSVKFAGVSHAGTVRENNEDSWRADMATGSFVVADGMGGHASGEVASAIACETFVRAIQTPAVGESFDAYRSGPTLEAREQVLKNLEWVVQRAHKAVRSETEREKSRRGMGCTLDAVVLVASRAFVAHVGDGRVYLTRPTATIQLTHDHTIGGSLVARGLETPSKPPPARNALTSVLGSDRKPNVEMLTTEVNEGDRLILVTDGVYGPLGDEATFQSFAPKGNTDEAAFALVNAALERKGRDNATALVVDVFHRIADQVAYDGGLAQRDFAYACQCPLFADLDKQLVGRTLSAAVEVSFGADEHVPRFFTNDRVGYIVLEGQVALPDGWSLGASSLLYPESLASGGKKGSQLCMTKTPVRALRIRADDFREVCSADPELAAMLYERLARTVVG